MKKIVAAIVVIVLLAVLAFLFFSTGDPRKSTSASTQSVAADAGEYVEDVHYRAAGERNQPGADKILVQEFFWYGCPHCQSFEPAIRDYKNQLPDDVDLVQIPVIWNEATGLHAAMHYVAMESEDPEALQDELFAKIISVRQEGNLQKHIDALEPVFESHGIDAGTFRDRLKSPDIKDKASSAAALMRSSGITGTPSIMVDGTWVVLNNEAVAKAGPLSVADHLIEMVRQARQ